MGVYFDACCLNRLTDDQSQQRIRKEAEAVADVLGLIREEQAIWVSSTVLEIEISRNPTPRRCLQRATLESRNSGLWLFHCLQPGSGPDASQFAVQISSCESGNLESRNPGNRLAKPSRFGWSFSEIPAVRSRALLVLWR